MFQLSIHCVVNPDLGQTKPPGVQPTKIKHGAQANMREAAAAELNKRQTNANGFSIDVGENLQPS